MASHKYNYFDALVQMTEFACEASKYLVEAIQTFDPATLLEKIEVMRRLEHTADEKRHEIMTYLAKEFLPPIEREDIIELTSKIDDIVDSIDEILHHFYLYNVQALLPECLGFSQHIVLCCDSVRRIAIEFHNFRKSSTIRDSIILTNRLESEGDKLYNEAIRKIFTSDFSERQVVVWTRIIASLEDCCDYCEDVSELFDSVIMKNS